MKKEIRIILIMLGETSGPSISKWNFLESSLSLFGSEKIRTIGAEWHFFKQYYLKKLDKIL